MGKGRAPGKVILAGEHFVLHGAPALAVPLLTRGVQVEVGAGGDTWEVQPSVLSHLLGMLKGLDLDPDEVSVRVESTLPIGAGLGGSAALAVALVRAVRGGTASPEAVRAEAHELEKLAHGKPSGIDDAVATWEAPVLLARDRSLSVLDLPVPPGLWIGVTSDRTSTREAVGQVADLAAREPERVHGLAQRSAELCDQILVSWEARDWAALGQLLHQGHGLLQSLEVSTPSLDRLVESALSQGAWGAKLTGGGLGGAVVALAPPDLDLSDAWRDAGAQEVIAS
ncbi:MAG: mevalonate kinase [Myxococcota bacterium]|nr:mevalonate kinase [Myxococcota bacterium]